MVQSGAFLRLGLPGDLKTHASNKRPMDPLNIKRTFKVVLLGDTAVGKSSLVKRYVEDCFDIMQESTIGAAFYTKRCRCNDTMVELQLWDTAGQERYASLAPMYYRNADGVIVVYDVTCERSFEEAKRWIREVENAGGFHAKAVILLVGNKSDLDEKDHIRAEIEHPFYIKTSAANGTNVQELFKQLSQKMLDELPTRTEQSSMHAIIEESPSSMALARRSCGC